MQIKLLNGNTANLKLRKYKFDTTKKSKSKFQRRIGLQLKQELPHDIIFEEVIIPGEKFVLDFFIPSANIVVECQGRQHKQHVKFFHNNKRAFHDQIDRDRKKRDWCKLNGFKLIEIDYGNS